MNVIKVFKSAREWLCLVALLMATCCFAQSDPGPRGGAPGAGSPIGGLTPGELDFFNNHGVPQFIQVEGVADGLGPRFNLNSCGGCHIQPALEEAAPPAIRNSPMRWPWRREIRCLRSSRRMDRCARRGSSETRTARRMVACMHSSRSRDARMRWQACSIQQPDFAAQLANHNVIFRIPTPTFGAGLIEAITNTAIRNNLANDPGGLKANNGIKGHVNTSGNDGTVTRFGWKAQNKSLLIFSGEAYNVEMGVTNENFQNEREENAPCAANGTPESHSGFNVGSTDVADIVAFMGFMKFLDQPAPVSSYGNVSMASINNGRSLFRFDGVRAVPHADFDDRLFVHGGFEPPACESFLGPGRASHGFESC